MPNTPILNLPLMTTSQAQKEVVFNELAIAFDALFKGSVLDTTLTTPPGSPAAGDAYIIPAGATGAWNGNTGKVAFYCNGWQFVNASLKMRLYSVAQSEFFVYQSTNTWTAEPASTVSVLNDLTNVSGVPTNGQVLQFSTGDNKWRPWTIAFPALALSALSDVNVTEGSGIDGKALAWNNADAHWEPMTVLKTAPPLLTLPDVVATGAADGMLLAYGSTAGPLGSPALHFVAPSSLISVSALNQVGDVSYPVGGPPAITVGAGLVWNGAAWAPSTSAPTYAVENLSDGPGAMAAKAHYFVRVAASETAWEYLDPTTVVGITSLSALTDVSVAEGAGIDGHVLAWNNGATKWEPLTISAVAVSGHYADLTGTPALATVAASGAYADLTGKPTVPTNASFSLSALGDVHTTGLTNNQVLAWNAGDGRWENQTPGAGYSTLASLTDVNVAEGAGINGKALIWNQGDGKWEAGSVGTAITVANNGTNVTTAATTLNFVGATSITNSGGDVTITLPTGGGGSGTLAGDTDVAISALADNQILSYSATAGKWVNATFSSSNLTPTVPVVVQYGTSTAAYAGTSTAHLPTAPTPGNLILLMCAGFGGQTLTPPTGFSTVFIANPTSNQQVAAFAKPAVSGDGTSYGVTSGHDYNAVVAYEISGVGSLSQVAFTSGAAPFTGSNLSVPVWTANNQIGILAIEADTSNLITITSGQSAVTATPVCTFPGNHVSAQAVIAPNEFVNIAATCTATPTNPCFGFVTLTGGTALAAATLAGDSDVTITSPASGQALIYNATAGKWENGSAGSALTISNNGTPIDTAATTINFIGATSITTSGHDVTVTLPTGGGGGGGGGVGASGPHRYWRIRGVQMVYGHTAWGASLVAFRDATGAIISTGGTPYASYTDTSGGSTWSAAAAFSGTSGATVGWYSGNDNTSNGDIRGTNSWLAYDFGAGVAVASAELAPIQSYAWTTPQQVAVEYSDDNKTWTLVNEFVLTTGVDATPQVCTLSFAPVSVAVSSWTALTFSGAITGFGAGSGATTFNTSVQTFTLAAGEILEIEGVVHRGSSGNAEVVASPDGSTGYSIAVQGDGNFVPYRYQPGVNSLGLAPGSSSVNAYAGYYKVALGISASEATGSKQNNVWARVNGYVSGEAHDSGYVEMVGSAIRVYLETDDLSKCNLRARVIGPATLANIFD